MLKQHFKQPFRKYMYGSRFFSDLLTGTMRSLIEPVVSGCLVLLLSSVFFVVVVVVVVVLVVITHSSFRQRKKIWDKEHCGDSAKYILKWPLNTRKIVNKSPDGKFFYN